MEEYDFLFKVVLIGNSSAGKTSLVSRFIDHHFDGDTQKATVGVQFGVASIPLQSGAKAKLQVWDTAGQERYRAISGAYYRGAHGVILVYDITDQKSFDDLQGWYREVREHHPDIKDRIVPEKYEDELEYEMAYEEQRLNAPILYLIGNKSDLGHQRVISVEAATAFAEQHDMEFRETSAKVGSNVFDAFLQLATALENQQIAARRLDSVNEKNILARSNIIKLDDPNHTASRDQPKKCNC